jgi:hypothetical protein
VVIPAQEFKQTSGHARVKTVRRQELDNQRTAFAPQPCGLVKEPLEQWPGTPELPIVRDRSRDLNRESKVWRRGTRPLGIGGRGVRPMK